MINLLINIDCNTAKKEHENFMRNETTVNCSLISIDFFFMATVNH